MRLLLMWLVVCLFSPAIAQLHIKVKIDQLTTDSVWFGTTKGKRALPLMGARIDASGWAELKTDSVLAPGFYAVMFKRAANARYTFLSLVVDDARRFTIETAVENPYSHARIEGNPAAAAYVGYYDKFMGLVRQRDVLNDDYRLLETQDALDSLISKEKSIRQYQLQLLESSKSPWVRKAVSWSLLPDLETIAPTADGRRLAYERDFEDILKADDLTLRLACPLFIERLDLNTFKLYNTVEPTKKLTDAIWNSFERYPELLEYYFIYMVNSFSMMTRFSMDEVFAHLFNSYVKPGKTPWITSDERSKMSKQVSDMQGTLIGDRAANVRVFTQDMKPVFIDNLPGPYTLLVFWDPGCGHCQKELPVLKNICAPLVEKKRLTVASFCMTKDQTFDKCRDFVKEKALPDNWLYLHDPTGPISLSKAYNLRTYPRLYLLDSNKRIVYRRSGEVTEQELAVMLERLTAPK